MGKAVKKRKQSTAVVEIPKRQTKKTALLKTASHYLNPNHIPSQLTAREDQFEEIYCSIHDLLDAKAGGCIYVSGTPGTGKTLTVKKVIQTLQEESCTVKQKSSKSKGKIVLTTDEYDDESQEEDSSEEESESERESPGINMSASFNYYEINGMRVTEPTQVYTLLCSALFGGKKLPAQQAMKVLESHFTNVKRRGVIKSTVVLIDELDQLITPNQKVIYNLFDWPNRPSSSLIVVAIANTMDLPERALVNRSSSRLGLSRISFAPYTFTQLESIVKSRLAGVQVFVDDAVEMCARKVSHGSGDARKALEICRRSIEILTKKVEDGETADNFVSEAIIKSAMNEIFGTPSIEALRKSSTQQKIMLASILRRLRINGRTECAFDDVAFTHIQTCVLHNKPTPTIDQLELLLLEAHFSGWINFEMGNTNLAGLDRKISLSLMEEDLVSCLKTSTGFLQGLV